MIFFLMKIVWHWQGINSVFSRHLLRTVCAYYLSRLNWFSVKKYLFTVAMSV
jgi:hypothetical protein